MALALAMTATRPVRKMFKMVISNLIEKLVVSAFSKNLKT